MNNSGLAEKFQKNLPTFQEYTSTFIQRQPCYGIKQIGKSWKTKKKPLGDNLVEAHLQGKLYVGSLGRWYPDFCILDFDDRPIEDVYEVQDRLKLDDSNSMVAESESKDSYHLMLKPVFKDKPPTLRLLSNAFKGFTEAKGIEIYPQSKKVVRLPFGPHQPLIYPHHLATTWKEKLYWFEKLDPFDLGTIPRRQLELDLEIPAGEFPIAQQVSELLAQGLTTPSSREYAQFCLLLNYYRQNWTAIDAVKFVWNWLQRNHNGFSKDYLRYPHECLKHITRQAGTIWDKYDLSKTYPDATHNSHKGYICKPDIEQIIRVSQGSLPKMRFLFELVKFINPRRHRNQVGVHSDKLIEWSSKRAYQQRISELQTAGIIQDRGKSYQTDRFSKSIKLNWEFRTSSEAVLFDGRSIQDMSKAIRMTHQPEEFKEILKQSGVDRRTQPKVLKSLFDEA